MLTREDKEEIKNIVVDVIREVVLPAFEIVATKDDIKDMATKHDIRRLEEKLDDKLENHEKRIKKLEHTVAN